MSKGTKLIRSGRVESVRELLRQRVTVCGEWIAELMDSTEPDAGVKIAVIMGKQSAYNELLEELGDVIK